MKMKMKGKNFPDILSRFRNDVQEFSQKFGGVEATQNKKSSSKVKKPLTRKQKRKLERKFKSAKKLAYSKKEKMPTLESMTGSGKKKPKQQQQPAAKESNQIKEKKPKPDDKKVDENSVKLVEEIIIKEEKQKKNFEKTVKRTHKRKLIEDNQREEDEIRRLEKKLHIKKDSKNLKKSFYEEGLAELLDFCDEKKRSDLLKTEASYGNLWLGGDGEDEENHQNDNRDEDNNDQDGFFIRDSKKSTIKKQSNGSADTKNKKSVRIEKSIEQEDDDEDEYEDDYDEDEDEGSFSDEDDDPENDEEIGSDDGEDDDDEEEDFSDEEEPSEKDEDTKSDVDSIQNEYEQNQKELKKKGLKEDIYGRIVDKQGNVLKTEKYVPPAQRLKDLLEKSSPANVKLIKLNKLLNGLLNRLSTSNMHSIVNQIMQIFYSNEYSRYDLMETIYNLIDNSIIKQTSLTPIRLIVEHSALIAVLTGNIGIELGANLVQKLCQKLDAELKLDASYSIEKKTFDNLILLMCNLYNFRLFSSNLLIDIVKIHLLSVLSNERVNLVKIEKSIDLILLILRSVGFSLRKDSPVELKDLIVNMQTCIQKLKNDLVTSGNEKNTDDLINNRLKFMIESINAIKNNDLRRLDAFDHEPIDQIKKQWKNLFKDDQILMNITYKDLINANEQGRWWIVGSAWNLKENQPNESDELGAEKEKKTKAKSILGESETFSSKILQLAKEQHMNTDVRKAIFCIIVSAEDYTDAFMKLVKLSLKKQQEREIIYVIMHCALNEKVYNPYYSYLIQKFCEYDRRFKMTLQFHTWDKFKLITNMTNQQITNFSKLYVHLIGIGAMSLSVLKNVEFGEMTKSMLQFLRELFTGLLTKHNDEQIQEMFMKIATIKKLNQLKNALKLFIVHFMLTDRGQTIEIDEKLKTKCEFVEKILSVGSND